MIIQTRSNQVCHLTHIHIYTSCNLIVQLLLRQALECWVQKVVFVRLREIETIEHRDINLLRYFQSLINL